MSMNAETCERADLSATSEPAARSRHREQRRGAGLCGHDGILGEGVERSPGEDSNALLIT
jgi:hypothetical protein